MLPHCEFLSIHAPGGAATDKMIDAKALALLPNGAVLVNVARGSLVDEDALLDALTSGKLFGAGLDVFRDEPDFDMRFAPLENVVLSPHVGSGSKETRDAMGFRALTECRLRRAVARGGARERRLTSAHRDPPRAAERGRPGDRLRDAGAARLR